MVQRRFLKPRNNRLWPFTGFIQSFQVSQYPTYIWAVKMHKTSLKEHCNISEGSNWLQTRSNTSGESLITNPLTWIVVTLACYFGHFGVFIVKATRLNVALFAYSIAISAILKYITHWWSYRLKLKILFSQTILRCDAVSVFSRIESVDSIELIFRIVAS